MITRTFAAALALGLMAVALADDYEYGEDNTDEHKAVTAIAEECGNPWFEAHDDDGDDARVFDDDHGSASCAAGVDGCSVQFIKLPKTMAAMKALSFENIFDDDYDDDYTEEDFNAKVAEGGRKFCLPDGFQARMEAEGWSLDNYYSKHWSCAKHSGDAKSCMAAGCGSDDDDGQNGHYCSGQSHNGITDSSAREAAAAEKAFSDLFEYGGSEYYNDYTDEHKAVMVIGGECGNHQLYSSDDDRDDDDASASCDDGVDGCSMQLVKMPKTFAAIKARGFDYDDDDDYVGNDDFTEEDWNAEIAKGGYKFCLPDDFQKRATAAGWSLDTYYSKAHTCYTHEGDPKSCLAAGCGSEINDDYDGNDDGHFCNVHSHHGLTSNSAAKKAAVKLAEKSAADAQAIVVTLQKAKTTACAVSATSAECTGAVKAVEDAVVTLNMAKSALNAAENYDLDSATGVTASFVVVVLSAIATFF